MCGGLAPSVTQATTLRSCSHLYKILYTKSIENTKEKYKLFILMKNSNINIVIKKLLKIKLNYK